ncbi:MAG: response regulator [Opitutales bacterium]|nr:response regulator [Opitutales bacterium]NRA25889.1 response regulator [Opitutales bacterium]
MSELRKILIIDDEEFIRESLGDHFEDRGWVVCTAESGEAALMLMETVHPDACLVDVRMGGMDGDTFVSMASEKFSGPVYAIYTGSPEYALPAEFRNLRHILTEPIRKPVQDMDKLVGIIADLIDRNCN